MQLSQSNPKEDPDKDNPELRKAIERNIRSIIHLDTQDAKERADLEMETEPEDVPAEIHRLQTIESSKR